MTLFGPKLNQKERF